MLKGTEQKKTENLNLMISKQTKLNLRRKAEELGLSITGYIEKISNEPIIYGDLNLRRFLDLVQYSKDNEKL